MEEKRPTTINGRFTLALSPLSELLDLFHGREATHQVDKVYALLGMASDDNILELLPDYKVPWNKLFYRITRYFFCHTPPSDTYVVSEEVSTFTATGTILGTSDQVAAMPSLGLAAANLSRPGSVRGGDIVCRFSGARTQTVIRPYHDYWLIVALGIQIKKHRTSTEGRDCIFVVVWDWKRWSHTTAELGRDDFENIVRINPCSFPVLEGPEGADPRPFYTSQAKRLASMAFGWSVLGQMDHAYDLFQQAMAPSDEAELAPEAVVHFADKFVSQCGSGNPNIVSQVRDIVEVFGRGKQMAQIADQCKPDFLKFLLEHPSGRFRITHDAILSIAKNRWTAAIMDLLMKHFRRELEFSIKPSLLEQVASCREFASQIVMAKLLKHGGDRINNPTTMEAAARNPKRTDDGKSMLGLLLQTSSSTSPRWVSEGIVRAAATNCQNMLELLTNKDILFHVTKDVVVAITSNPDPQSLRVLGAF